MINLDFILALPRSRRQHDSFWEILDRMTKLTHFLPVKTTHSPEDYQVVSSKVGHRLESLGFHLLVFTDRRGMVMMGLDIH